MELPTDGADGNGRAVTSWPRYVAVGVVATLVVAVAAVAATRSGEPPVISIAGGAADGGELRATAEMAADDAAPNELTIWNPVEYRFELGDGARVDAGEATAWRLTPPEDLAAAAGTLADRFGLGAVSPAEWDPTSIVAGDADGRGPSLWVGPSGDWSYSDAGDVVEWACAEPALVDPPLEEAAEGDVGAEGDRPGVNDPGDSGRDGEARTGGDDDVTTSPSEPAPDVAEPAPDVAECEPPPPPEGVPGAEEARRLAAELFGDLELPGEVEIADVHADEWGAWVQASITVDGLPTDLWASVGYGAEGRLSSANGSLADAERVADYPTIDAEAAVERLGSDQWTTSGGGVRPLMESATGDDVTIAQAPASHDAPPPPDEPATEPRPDEPVEDLPQTDELPDAGTDDPPPPPDELPPAPDAPSGEPEIVTVTLTDVEHALLLQYDADGVAWLLPGYRFADGEGGQWSVLAVADDYLDVAEPSDAGADEPGDVEPQLPVEPGDTQQGGGVDGGHAGEPVPGPPAADPDAPVEGGNVAEPTPGDGGSGSAEAQDTADRVVGMTEEQAVATVEEAGLVARVVARDDERFAVTEDLRGDRVNLEVKGGEVVGARVG